MRFTAVMLLCAASLATACAPTKAAMKAPPPKSHFGALGRTLTTTPLLGPNAPNTSVVAVDAGVAGDRVSGLVEVPADECAVLIARAGPSVEDVDLLAYGEDGSTVGTDEGPDKTPALLVCPPHPTRIWVTARIAAGHGLVAVGVQRLSPTDAPHVAQSYGITDASNAASRIRNWPGLDEHLEAHRREVGGEWQDVRRVAIPLDARVPTRVSAQVDADRCLDVFVAPSDDAGHIELVALDASGSIIARAASSGRERALVICSPLEAAIALELRPQSGRGVGVLVLSRSRANTELDGDVDVTHVELFPSAELAAEVATVEARLSEQAGYAKGKQLASGTLEVGRRNSLNLNLPKGCVRLDVVGGKPLRGLEAVAWSSQGELVSRGRGGGTALLFVCGMAGSVRLDLEATLRPGPYAVVMHTEAEVPSSLLAAPLAAGRLLGHLVTHGVLRRPGEVVQAQEVQLSDTGIRSLDLTVPIGRCVDVALALGADTLGAEIRLVSVSRGVEITSGRGAHAASARVCSLDASSANEHLKTRAELRVSAGKGIGLVATRMLTPAR
ncbi:MAG TPA: hypothetical protein VFQ35_14945 [Polyangiaceae bacterium]|nr:hypothetical protein [Polyangiaceae bacterium]